jgi:hypothetical protein
MSKHSSIEKNMLKKIKPNNKLITIRERGPHRIEVPADLERAVGDGCRLRMSTRRYESSLEDVRARLA